jgi:diguanylate cyclase (GGDEF)-like protein
MLRLRHALIYCLVAVVLLSTAVWLFAELYAERARIIADRTQIALEKSRFMSQWLGTLVTSCDYVLRDVSEKVVPGDLARASPGEIERISLWLGSKVASVPGVEGISLYGPDLVFRVSNPLRLIGFRSNQSTPTRGNGQSDGKARLQYIPPEKSANGKPSILVIHNEFSRDGAFTGGGLAAIDLGIAQGWIGQFGISSHDVLAVMDAGGTLLARNPLLPEEIGKKTDLLRGQAGEAGGSSSHGIIAEPAGGGRRLIYGSSAMEGIPITVLVGYDLGDALLDWQRRAWQTAFGFALIAALSLTVIRALIVAQHQREALRTLATTDSLTGLANRKLLFETGEREAERADRYNGALSVMMVDIDHFKQINDTWGHPVGDRVIQAVTRTMNACVRKQDLVGRIGGEEFAVLLPETALEGGRTIADRVLKAVHGSVSATAPDGSPICVTVSIGVVSADRGEAFETALGRADQCLYRAKEGGRNRVISPA